MTWNLSTRSVLGFWVLGCCLCAATGLANADDEASDSQRAIDAAREELAALMIREQISPAESALIAPRYDRETTSNPLTTYAIPPAPAVPPSEGQTWLKELELPDLPVRWEEQLVSLLEYYRSNAKGQAVVSALLERSGAYEDMVFEKLRAARLPDDLFYVAMVESGYDIQARSGAGAVGMWQFVASTATDHGLTVDRWADQRLSPEHATEAALKFLASLHSRLKSWPLVLAAYNMGYSAISRSIQKYNSNDFWVLASLEAGLPYETVNYVSKVIAYAIVARNPEAFGLQISKQSARDAVLVEVPGGTSLSRIARAAGLRLDELKSLNPELKKNRVPPDVENWQVHLTQAAAERFAAKWSAQRPRLASHRDHLLRLGERLSDVAAMYETSTSKLLALNELTSESEVHAGTTLRVPDVEPSPVERTERPLVGVPQGHFNTTSLRQYFYRVIDGDSVDEIARCFKVSVDELLQWNAIDADAALADGMFLQLFVPKQQDLSGVVTWKPSEVQVLVVGSESFFDRHEEQRNRKRIRYTVKEGDTLATLSERFGLSVGSIARINRFSRYETPKPDSEIILYVENEAKN